MSFVGNRSRDHRNWNTNYSTRQTIPHDRTLYFSYNGLPVSKNSSIFVASVHLVTLDMFLSVARCSDQEIRSSIRSNRILSIICKGVTLLWIRALPNCGRSHKSIESEQLLCQWHSNLRSHCLSTGDAIIANINWRSRHFGIAGRLFTRNIFIFTVN